MADDHTATDTTVLAVLQKFAEAGWSSNFVAEPAAAFRCTACGAIVQVADSDIGARHRVEGASDPADMQLVVGLTCPKCQTGGVMVLGYGPMASELDQAIVIALDESDVRDPVANRTTETDPRP